MAADTMPRLRNTVERAVNKAGRELNARVPYFRDRAHRSRAQLRAEHAPNLPMLAPGQAEMLAQLRNDGALVTTLMNLGVPNTEELQVILEDRRADLEAAPRTGERAISLGTADLARDPLLWRWGLADELLDLAESYLGLPPIYYGAQIRCEVANGEVANVRQWHMDVEDDRMLKILVWLGDVDIAGGPFEYVPKSASAEAQKRLSYVSGFVPEGRFSAAVDPSDWRAATGPIWTAAVADTCAVFHRAKAPTGSDRYSVTFSYSTNSPRKIHPVEPFSDAQLATILADLTDRQLRALPVAIGPFRDY